MQGFPVLLSAVALLGLQAAGVPQEPTTQVERLSLRSNQLVQRRLVLLGTMGRAEFRGITVSLLEPDKGTAQGLRVTLRSEGKPERDTVGFLDMDELEGLVASLDAMIQIADNPSDNVFTEVSYATRGGLRVGHRTLGNDRHAFMTLTPANEVSQTQILKVGELQVLRQILLDGLTRLRGNR